MHLLWLKMYAPAGEQGDDAALVTRGLADGFVFESSPVEDDEEDSDVGAPRAVSSDERQ
jgi:hypothetical protein